MIKRRASFLCVRPLRQWLSSSLLGTNGHFFLRTMQWKHFLLNKGPCMLQPAHSLPPTDSLVCFINKYQATTRIHDNPCIFSLLLYMSHGGLYQPVTRSSVCSTSTQAETKSQFLERLQISEYLIPPYLHLPSDNHEHLFNMNLSLLYIPQS